MKVYVIIGRDYEDSFIYAIVFKDKLKAEKEKEQLIIQNNKKSSYEYEITECDLVDE